MTFALFWFALFCALTSAVSMAEPSFEVVAMLRDEAALAGAHDVEVRDGFAFVAGKRGALALVDVRNPAAPKLVWHRHDPVALEDCETVLPMGHRLFVGTRDFLSFDISDPREPKLLATIRDRTRIDRMNGFARRGTLVLAANKNGWLDAFDVSNPLKPRLFGALNVRARDALKSPHDVDVMDDFSVTVDGAGFGRNHQPGKVAVHRIADAGTHELLPVEKWKLVSVVESADLAGANRVKVAGRHAFIAASLNQSVVSPERTAKGVVIDLTDPTNARQVAAVNFSDARGPNGQTLAGHVWFLAGGQTVEAWDIRTPAAPKKLATFRSSEAFPNADDSAHDLVYRDGHLYVTAQNDDCLVILKIRDERLEQLAAKAH